MKYYNQQLILPRRDFKFRSIYLLIIANILKNSGRSSVLPRTFLFDRPFWIFSKLGSKPDQSLGWKHWAILVIPVPLVCESFVVSRSKSQNILQSWIVTYDVHELRLKWVRLSLSWTFKSFKAISTAVWGWRVTFGSMGTNLFSANQTKVSFVVRTYMQTMQTLLRLSVYWNEPFSWTAFSLVNVCSQLFLEK